MNFDKYTQTSANVINASSSLARTYENSQIEVEHLIYSMLDNKTLIYEILEKCNIDTNGLKLSLLNTIKNMPKRLRRLRNVWYMKMQSENYLAVNS